ncbi:hypothetical protein Cni_G22644 [Canna indica]|uniref:Reverse transcriptase domain-containing protein n=1 Tax=Canna indica TaxID=4628 RepID=A0AAQ3KSS3_9LILI|nr:hypothetical protein Cni_G22644 [Canna indica]
MCGIRQGNPLSPLLFNLVADVLSRFIERANRNGLFCGALGNHSSGGITHVFYADDLIMFCDGSSRSFQNIRLLFKCFELAFGLKLNMEKTSVIHLSGDSTASNRVANIFGCVEGSLPFNYHGLPLKQGKLLKSDWTNLILKVDKLLASWQGLRINLWKDKWMRNDSLQNKFPRLFNLTTSKDTCIADAKILNEAGETVGWDINFSIFVSLSEVLELAKDLEEILHCSGEDIVEWKWNSFGVFSTSSLYKKRLHTKDRLILHGMNLDLGAFFVVLIWRHMTIFLRLALSLYLDGGSSSP